MSDLEERLQAIEVLLGIALGNTLHRDTVQHMLDEALVSDQYRGQQTEWHRTFERVYTIALRHVAADLDDTPQQP